jgi:hypothetical protein
MGEAILEGLKSEGIDIGKIDSAKILEDLYSDGYFEDGPGSEAFNEDAAI